MSTVWYIRHGESESNVRGVFAGGQDNTPLTKKGRAQASQAGSQLAAVNIDRIICSPLDRAFETAKIIASKIGFDGASITKDDRWIEYDVGNGNGLPFEGMTSKQLVSFKSAEDPEQFMKRVRDALKDASEFTGNTLIVAHGGVGKLINCMKSGDNPEKFYDYPKLPNAEPIKLDLNWL